MQVPRQFSKQASRPSGITSWTNHASQTHAARDSRHRPYNPANTCSYTTAAHRVPGFSGSPRYSSTRARSRSIARRCRRNCQACNSLAHENHRTITIRKEGRIPKPMDCPRIRRSSGRIRIPELGLQEDSAGGVEAAGVAHGSGVVAAEGNAGGTALEGG